MRRLLIRILERFSRWYDRRLVRRAYKSPDWDGRVTCRNYLDPFPAGPSIEVFIPVSGDAGDEAWMKILAWDRAEPCRRQGCPLCRVFKKAGFEFDCTDEKFWSPIIKSGGKDA